MKDSHVFWTRRIGAVALSIVTAAVLATGVTWHGYAAETAAVQAGKTNVPAIARSVDGARDSYADIVKVVAPAVVTIRTEGKARMMPTAAAPDQDDPLQQFFDQFGFGAQQGRRGGRQQQAPEFRTSGLGSGVIVSADGYILTNHHVIDSADDIKVELTDGQRFDAKVVGSDEPTDLALLKVEGNGLPVLSLGDSDRVQVGDVVLAVGNPLNIGQTVTMGIVSAKGRRADGGEGYEEFLQTDAAINKGNSGGALVNMRGELVGINSQIASLTGGNMGIGFAIPANMARHVMDELKTDGRVRRALLGVNVSTVNADVASSLGLKDIDGAVVSNVERGSAADRAGLQPYDVIVAFNGREISDANMLRNRVAESTPGSKASVKILRDGKEQTFTVTLGESNGSGKAEGESSRGSSSDDRTLGVSVTPVTPDVAKRENLPSDVRGLLVDSVTPNSRAADAGLQQGDVIRQVNRKSVASADELRSAIGKLEGRPMLMLVNRDGRDLLLTVQAS